MANIQDVLDALNKFDDRNREDHQRISETLDSHGVAIACLQTKSKIAKWLFSLILPAAVALVIALLV